MFTTEQPTESPRDRLSLVVFAARGGLHAVHRPSEPLTEAALCDWIADAQVGESIQYHEGLLLRDRSATASPLPARERARIHATARRAWIACELGLVHLFSVRVGDGHFRYLALRSATVLKPQNIAARRRQPTATSPITRPQ